MTITPVSERLKKEHQHFRDPNDFYQEPVSCSQWLFAREKFLGPIYDPACGEGHVLMAALEAGYEVRGSDIVDRAGCYPVSDFLADEPAFLPSQIVSSVSNPPYKDTEAFIDKMLERTQHKVAVLVRLAFLEGQARRKKFDEWPLLRVWVFSPRVSMPPAGRGIKATGGTTAYCWLVFDKLHKGPPTLGWLP